MTKRIGVDGLDSDGRVCGGCLGAILPWPETGCAAREHTPLSNGRDDTWIFEKAEPGLSSAWMSCFTLTLTWVLGACLWVCAPGLAMVTLRGDRSSAVASRSEAAQSEAVEKCPGRWGRGSYRGLPVYLSHWVPGPGAFGALT